MPAVSDHDMDVESLLTLLFETCFVSGTRPKGEIARSGVYAYVECERECERERGSEGEYGEYGVCEESSASAGLYSGCVGSRRGGGRHSASRRCRRRRPRTVVVIAQMKLVNSVSWRWY